MHGIDEVGITCNVHIQNVYTCILNIFFQLRPTANIILTTIATHGRKKPNVNNQLHMYTLIRNWPPPKYHNKNWLCNHANKYRRSFISANTMKHKGASSSLAHRSKPTTHTHIHTQNNNIKVTLKQCLYPIRSHDHTPNK